MTASGADLIAAQAAINAVAMQIENMQKPGAVVDPKVLADLRSKLDYWQGYTAGLRDKR